MDRHTIHVGLGERSYPITIGQGILAQVGPALKAAHVANRYAIISDDQVGTLYGEEILASLEESGLRGELLLFAHGEASKHLDTVGHLARQLAQRGFDRSDGLIALGGGVCGDITGFLAAIYMRGIPFVQVPTSLLAQVDSSVGGKTGVDLPEGKNLIGAFYQPRAVFIDTKVLSTLAPEEFLGGMAEVIKYGAGIDAEFFQWLADHHRAILNLTSSTLATMIRRCCELKASVVEQDEREGGVRRILNFGHTVGHAVEAASGYRLNHGFAVAIGMVAAAQLGERGGYTDPGVVKAITGLLQLYELPTVLPAEFTPDTIRGYLRTDKKNVAGRLHFVLPVAVGKVVVTDRVIEADIDVVLTGGYHEN
ncbi:3-dehydroquinate synthase [Desulfobulbus alkaliphilus]|uniref:3-dehydroquinate synthase n=1 Tax=Desulfobulbus alkaliphilus TaxID=869814 RepID=UPI001965DC66|nr:3-dehydroquinate synthase [Desulfobulbus alkaliphilus]MBM9535537.1 3-dehydroquinate synthase [Desulfobulbus alkaliphilus]